MVNSQKNSRKCSRCGKQLRCLDELILESSTLNYRIDNNIVHNNEIPDEENRVKENNVTAITFVSMMEVVISGELDDSCAIDHSTSHVDSIEVVHNKRKIKSKIAN